MHLATFATYYMAALEVIIILMMSSCGNSDVSTMQYWLENEPTGLDVDANHQVLCSTLKPEHVPLIREAGIDSMLVFVDHSNQHTLSVEQGYAETVYDLYMVKKQVHDYFLSVI